MSIKITCNECMKDINSLEDFLCCHDCFRKIFKENTYLRKENEGLKKQIKDLKDIPV